jgi:hypothetical protein
MRGGQVRSPVAAVWNRRMSQTGTWSGVRNVRADNDAKRPRALALVQDTTSQRNTHGLASIQPAAELADAS